MKILMVLESHDQLGHTGHQTGVWLKEFAVPYFVFREAGVGPPGLMWDLVENPDSIALIESSYNSGKPAAAVTNGEQAAINSTHFVPFLVEAWAPFS